MVFEIAAIIASIGLLMIGGGLLQVVSIQRKLSRKVMEMFDSVKSSMPNISQVPDFYNDGDFR